MLKLSKTDVTPSGGWHCRGDCGLYEQPDAPMIRSGTLNDLIVAVTNYRIANMLPVENVRNEVEEWICRETRAKCRPASPEGSGDQRKITVADVWRFVKTITAWLKSGTLVEQAEAERRAEICAGCRYNVDLADGSCWGCAGIADVAQHLIGDKRTRMDALLKNCQICGCFSRISVWVPLELLKKSSGELIYPEDTGGRDLNGSPIKCWKK